MIAVPTLLSERLICVPMSLNFANNNYLNWLNDAEVNEYLEVPKENKLNDLIEYIKNSIEAKMFFWAILKKTDNKHIGNIKIDPINFKHGYGEYGILIGDKNEWGKGYAKESSELIIQFCFEKLGLRKINLGVIDKNHAAINLYKRLNFVSEGIYKKHVKHNDKFCDVNRMAVFNQSIKY